MHHDWPTQVGLAILSPAWNSPNFPASHATMHSLLGDLEPSLSPSAWQSFEGIVPPRSGGQSSLTEGPGPLPGW
eukprot:4963380-Pyramimonas_sp.AAC.1